MTAEPITIMDAQICVTNFEGRPDKYNRNGNRSFLLIIPENMVDDLLREGWNIKRFRPRPEDTEPPQAYLPVAVNFANRPPRITLIGNITGNRTLVDENSVNILDFVDREKVDVTISPYHWKIESSGESGVKAYLKTMYVIIREDELDVKYANSVED